LATILVVVAPVVLSVLVAVTSIVLSIPGIRASLFSTEVAVRGAITIDFRVAGVPGFGGCPLLCPAISGVSNLTCVASGLRGGTIVPIRAVSGRT